MIANFLFLAAGIALACAFWAATMPAVTAAQMTPTEMLQANLPARMTLAKASKQQTLSAVCGAVTKWRSSAPEIVRTAIEAHRNYAADIVGTAIRCLGQRPDCSTVVRIAEAAAAGDPDGTSAIMDSALLASPSCRGEIERAFRSGGNGEGNFDAGPVNQNGPPGSLPSGGGGFDPQEGKIAVCHNGQTLILPPKAAEQHLAHGDTAGPCNPTPVTNP